MLLGGPVFLLKIMERPEAIENAGMKEIIDLQNHGHPQLIIQYMFNKHATKPRDLCSVFDLQLKKLQYFPTATLVSPPGCFNNQNSENESTHECLSEFIRQKNPFQKVNLVFHI